MRNLIMSKSMAYPLNISRATHSQLDSYDSYEEPVATLLVLTRYWRLIKSEATQKDQSMARPHQVQAVL